MSKRKLFTEKYLENIFDLGFEDHFDLEDDSLRQTRWIKYQNNIDFLTSLAIVYVWNRIIQVRTSWL
jgi:hypothetical protein